MTRSVPHLVRRFFSVWRAAPLGPVEQAEAARLLRPAERALFWAQSAADQRHALQCARAVAARRPDRSDLIRAALLHDVGKRHAGLGAVGRAAATVLGALGLRGRGRRLAYLEHGPRGAAELEDAGAEPVVVAFALHHHGTAPAGVQPGDWAELRRADHI